MESKIYYPKSGAVQGKVNVIGSKSISQRAVWSAMLSEETSILNNLSNCDDVKAALNIAQKLGAKIEQRENQTTILGIQNYIDRKYHNLKLDCLESGFCLRSILPIAASNGSDIKVGGASSLFKRSIGREIELFSQYLDYSTTDYNYSIMSSLKPGKYFIESPDSSQLVSGLLYALPLLDADSILQISNPVSLPYLALTVDILRTFGINITTTDYKHYQIPGNQKYKAVELNIEGDYSAAAFFAVAAAISGSIELQNLNLNSKQGDLEIFQVLMSVGADIHYTDNSIIVSRSKLSSFNYDATNTPDLFPPLVALATQCEGISIIKGVHRLLEKESNRRDALVSQFRKLNAEIYFENDNMYIHGSKLYGAEVDSYNDHRIAMALSVAALRTEGTITLKNPSCITKSYPEFYNILETLVEDK